MLISFTVNAFYQSRVRKMNESLLTVELHIQNNFRHINMTANKQAEEKVKLVKWI